MHVDGWVWQEIKRATLDTFGGKLERGLGGLHVRMAPLKLGPTIFGGTDKIIIFLHGKHLLATRNHCPRYL